LGTDFWQKYLDRTLYAIEEITASKNGGEITVKKVRQVHGIQASNRSAINFYARTLIYLKDNGVLKSVENSSRSPLKYVLRNREKLSSLVKDRNSNKKNSKLNENASD
jgi:hypothetical protein